MDSTNIIEILAHYSVNNYWSCCLLFYDSHFRSTKHQTLVVAKDHQAATLPLRLQAYERMTLFMERINPSQLMVRIVPFENKKRLS
jgi:hypothetical protein